MSSDSEGKKGLKGTAEVLQFVPSGSFPVEVQVF